MRTYRSRSRRRGKQENAVHEAATPSHNGAETKAQQIPTYTLSQGETPAMPLLGGLAQAKLSISQDNDPQEREADNVAAQVTSETSSEPPTISSTARLETKTNAGMPVQQKHDESSSASVDSEYAYDATSGIVGNINAAHSGGQPLPASTRAIMETQFGQDFSQVRVHTNSQDAEAAESVNAQAFTVGQDMVFGPGKYAPETHSGQQLLAHELTHVVQQSANNDAGTVSSGETASPTVVQRQSTRSGAQPAPPRSAAAELLAPLPAGIGIRAEQRVRRWLRRNRMRFVFSSQAQVIAAVRSALPNDSTLIGDEAVVRIAHEVGITFLPGATPPAPARPPISESGPQADTSAPDTGIEPSMGGTVAQAVASYRDVNRAIQNALPNATPNVVRQSVREMEQQGTGESVTRQPPEEERRHEE